MNQNTPLSVLSKILTRQHPGIQAGTGTRLLSFIIAGLILLTTGCSGDDVPYFGDDTPDAEGVYYGQFLDSAVENLDYSSPTQSGTTDAKGRFRYRENETVTFAIGNTVLGETAGQAIVSPLNLAPDGNSSTPAVQNIARFLLALDQDDNPRNGITISPTVKATAKSWPSIDFSADDFDSQIATIITEAGNIDGRTAALPNAGEAKQHLESTIFCAYSGAYSGIYSTPSGNNGEWVALVDSAEGKITGFIDDETGSKYQILGQLNANAAMSFTARIFENTTSEWEGNLTSSGIFTANSGNVLGQKNSVVLSDNNTSGDIYHGSLAKGNPQADITDIYSIIFAVDGETITGRAYSLVRKTYIDIQPQLIDANTVQFSLEGIELIGGSLNSGDYISIAGDGGSEIVIGTACKTP